ncbi:hypothetical protein C8R44DRAFT_725197 [Mycena epipterygia]|nr:hypothetical protein C8R44DRAFT_725197 [Mycena epipterygia]
MYFFDGLVTSNRAEILGGMICSVEVGCDRVKNVDLCFSGCWWLALDTSQISKPPAARETSINIFNSITPDFYAANHPSQNFSPIGGDLDTLNSIHLDPPKTERVRDNSFAGIKNGQKWNFFGRAFGTVLGCNGHTSTMSQKIRIKGSVVHTTQDDVRFKGQNKKKKGLTSASNEAPGISAEKMILDEKSIYISEYELEPELLDSGGFRNVEAIRLHTQPGLRHVLWFQKTDYNRIQLLG